MIDYIEIELSNDKIVSFFSYPLDQAFDCLEGKLVNEDLSNALKDPANYRNLHSDQKSVIFLGFASDRPDDIYRFPVWLPADLITNHILIGGAIGSGKTTLTYRLIAGALENFGTVIIGLTFHGISER
jgi:DNA segregation ATPase FtsK/SpoIIIE-like protein